MENDDFSKIKGEMMEIKRRLIADCVRDVQVACVIRPSAEAFDLKMMPKEMLKERDDASRNASPQCLPLWLISFPLGSALEPLWS